MTHSRRRDVLKAAGTVVVVGGMAGCAQQDDGGGNGEEDTAEAATQEDGEMGAFRVAHASPDAPNVDVYFDNEAVVEDLGFREVSPYADVEPGTYQVQVTAAGDQETVVFDEEIEVQGGTASTAVAYGEASGGPENGFDVQILEDDLSDPGQDTSRVRLFHGVPDAQEVDVVVTQAPEGGDGGGNGQQQPPEEGQPEQALQEEQPEGGQQPEDGQQPPQQGEPLFEGVAFGDTASQKIPAGDYTLGLVPAGQPQSGGQQPQDGGQQQDGEQQGGGQQQDGEQQNDSQQQNGGQQQEPVEEFDLSTESQTVYSAFAVGYLNPEEAEVDEEFEVVVTEDAQGGERADGGTDGGGMAALSH